MASGGKWTTGCLAKVTTKEEYDQALATVPRTKTPTRLRDFGYKYDEAGKLVQLSNGKPFAWLGQKHYDYLGDAIVNDIYALLEERYGLRRVLLPAPRPGDAPDTPRVPIFVSPDFDTCENVAFVCQGSGAVRPGMWARALCINDALSVGTIFSYLDACKARGWAVIVLNPNEHFVYEEAIAVQVQQAAGTLPPAPNPLEAPLSDELAQYWLGTPDPEWKRRATERPRRPVAHHSRPEEHACYVWEQFVKPAAAKRVAIIAHSYGGCCTTAVVSTFFDDVAARVPGIALTDAINDMFRREAHNGAAGVRAKQQLMVDRSCNWVASHHKLDTKQPSRSGAPEVSSGHDKHEWTSASCQPSVFTFLDAKFQAFGAAAAGVSEASCNAPPA